MLRPYIFIYTEHIKNHEIELSVHDYSGYHQLAPSKGFFFSSNLRFGGRQSTVTMVFHALAWRKFFLRLLSTRKNNVGVSAVFAIFCCRIWHLTALHVKITRRENLLSVFRRKLKLSTYLHTVSYNLISFLNRSQLVWVLASSGFYSITWRMISSKIHFRKQPPFRGNFFPFQCDIFCFFEFILASWQCVHGSRVFI